MFWCPQRLEEGVGYPELLLQMVVSPHVDAGNLTEEQQVL